MEKVGFFAGDLGEPVAAYAEQVDVKKMFGGNEGLEISVAGVNPGIGDGIRRIQALNRLDIPMSWRAMIRRGEGKRSGPTVTLLAPRGQTGTAAADKLGSAGLGGEGSMVDEGYAVTFAPGTAPEELVRFAVRALQALGYQAAEWQWTVRPKGVYPR